MDSIGLVVEGFTVDLESGDARASLLNCDAEGVDVDEKNLVKEEKCKKASSKKPPRPPRGPSVDATDLKFIKEITELTMLKRIRIERMKELKKMKGTKTSSLSYSLVATMFTVVFCCVILFQGKITNISLLVAFNSFHCGQH